MIMLFRSKAQAKEEREKAKAVERELKRKPREMAELATDIALRIGNKSSRLIDTCRFLIYRDQHVEITHYVSTSNTQSIKVNLPAVNECVLNATMSALNTWTVATYRPGEWERYLKEVLWPEAEDKPAATRGGDFRNPINDSNIFKDVFEH